MPKSNLPDQSSPPDESYLVYRGDESVTQESITANAKLQSPPAPPWREFKDDPDGAAKQQALKGGNFKPPDVAKEMVNAALTLRRPLLITGNPGTGKSTLAYAVARELALEPVLKWAITTRTTLKDGLYTYDAIARLQDARGEDNRIDTGKYITLGPLGTAFVASDRPRVLLIDEIDKSDIDLPNDLLNLFEDGEFAIPELQRLELGPTKVNSSDREKDGNQKKVDVNNGFIRCRAFPLVIMTSNGERDFPPPFLRRCLRFRMPDPNPEFLKKIVEKHLGEDARKKSENLVTAFCDRVARGETLATDQLLNVIHWRTQEKTGAAEELTDLEKRLLKDLNSPEE
jgi:MoxR-like ATPase